jgi:hypothetical protein
MFQFPITSLVQFSDKVQNIKLLTTVAEELEKWNAANTKTHENDLEPLVHVFILIFYLIMICLSILPLPSLISNW